MHAIDAESALSTEAVLEHRLALAASHLGWSQPRISAFRDGLADARAGRVDRARRHLRTEDDGYDEAALSPGLVDALGYADGVSAAESAALPPVRFHGPEEILEEVDGWAGNGDGDFEVDEAEWTHEAAGDLAPFLAVMDQEAWISWFVDEHRTAVDEGRPGYGDLLVEDIIRPVVHVAYEGGRIDVWDGFHRIGAAMLKGAGTLPQVRGVPPSPTPAP